MARVPDVPHDAVDVDADADALDVRVDPAPSDVEPNEFGVTLLADVVLHGRSDTVARLRVQGSDDFHYAAIVVRGGIAELVHFEALGADRYGARIAVGRGETLHLTVVASDFETGIAWLEHQVAQGGMGMGGEPEAAAEPPPPPRIPDVVLGGGFGGRSPGLAPVAPPPAPAPPPMPGPAPPPVAAGPVPPPEAVTPSGGLDGAAPVPAFVDAEVPARVVEGVEFDAIVRLSLADLAPTAGAARKKATALFDPSREIEVAMQLRGLAFADGTPSIISTMLPTKGSEPRRLVFALIPDGPGRGHITVTFTQPPIVTPLAVLALSTPIVAADDDVEGIGADDPRTAVASVAAPPRSIADLPTLVIDESMSRGASELLVTAKIGRTVVKHSVRLPDKSAYVEGIYSELSAVRKTFLESVEDDPDEAADTARRGVRTLGARVATELLGDEVNALLWSRRRRTSQLVLQTSGELDIPWEIVHLVPVGRQRPDPERYFLGDLGLTRWMYGTPRPTVIPVDPTRVVAIAPDYVDHSLDLPRAREEIETIGDLLAGPPRSAADPIEFRQAIQDGFDLLHFAGHGRWRDIAPLGQEIAFAAFSADHDDGSASYTDSDARRDLPELDTAAPTSTPFVFLSACDVGRLRSGATGLGGFAEVFLRGGVGVFIGCSWAVRDDVTALFVRTFYQRTLGENATVGEAVLAARRAAREAGDLTSLAFTVFADPRARLVPRAAADGGDHS
ncbi:CHAT domain-containing protein [Microbacterium trichothecenolyticum]|uniref:CHAT domain protein n=1 Tax=Microbacterium trichothecenolyticum TaxID=69370 RepID=A0A0M2H828_MICTR|nr:CHAT domain-containing protein [Microbacterium trichothecenolyticum]KJL40741.1 CHAT domain protein [Microbacterium trichothecenolyticum]